MLIVGQGARYEHFAHGRRPGDQDVIRILGTTASSRLIRKPEISPIFLFLQKETRQPC